MLLCLGLCACEDAHKSRTGFYDSKQLGDWYSDEPAQQQVPDHSRPPNTGEPSETGDVGEGSGPSAANGSNDGQQGGRGGQASTPSGSDDAHGGSGGSPQTHGSAGRASAANGGGGSAASAEHGPNVMVSFTTVPQFMKVVGSDSTCVNTRPDQPTKCYGPDNAGATWITTKDGEFVKTLELWASVRREHLVGYAAACGCVPSGSNKPKVDVTATASRIVAGNKMPDPMHSAIWNGTDRTGSGAPPGAYVLHVEVADCDAADTDQPNCKNALLDVPLDTGTKTATIPPMPMFFQNVTVSFP